MTAILFLKASVKGHTRQVGAKVVYVAPYENRVPGAKPDAPTIRDPRQADLFAGAKAPAPSPRPAPTPTPPAAFDAERVDSMARAVMAFAAAQPKSRDQGGALPSPSRTVALWKISMGPRFRITLADEDELVATVARLARIAAALPAPT